MSRKMLVDAAHAEETRVVVLDGNRVEEFDFESRARKQLRGNIYLAKITRVEPSLQAAFVEYGGNRHGFLAFNEIHPDYYQIPHADREALLREAVAEGGPEDDDLEAAPRASEGGVDEEGEASASLDDDEDQDEEVARQRRRLVRRYKIQEVVKRRQIMLVQVVKEERGNKGAALTTYLSLAGRYCVLMPNTDRGGGISRKITTLTDRKRLRTIVGDLEVPPGMGLIVRTAGAKRTKAEIKRDYEYLSRAWENIRDTTLHSIAPALIYEEEDLVKRAIRDLYDKDLEGIWVEGEAGFREARDFMRMLMPSQAKKIQAWREPTPLFVSHKVEDHLALIYSPTVPLRSGGYLVINQTEALVAVDVNSGRSTRERNIEATALKTNLEAAEEAARQLRLRDLAGLIVIDFIDMDEAKNNRAVEKKLKDCLKDDRARIQTGRISEFGLMELSRQRRRTGILEVTTQVCPHCQGAGRVRSVESSALSALRALEMEAIKGGGEVVLRVARDVSLYILNHKREYLSAMLRSHGLFVRVVIDEALAHAEHEIDRISDVPHEAPRGYEGPSPVGYARDEDAESLDEIDEDEPELEDEEEEDDESLLESPAHATDHAGEADADGGRRRPRRRRRGRRGEETPAAAVPAPRVANGEAAVTGEGGHSRRRRGRRGGRRQREEAQASDAYGWNWPAKLSGADPYEWRGPVAAASPAPPPEAPSLSPAAMVVAAIATEAEPAAEPAPEMWVELPPLEEKPAKARRGRSRRAAPTSELEPPPVDATGDSTVSSAEPADVDVDAEAAAPASPINGAGPSAPVLAPQPVAMRIEPELAAAVAETPKAPDPAEIIEPAPAPRRGWWRRDA